MLSKTILSLGLCGAILASPATSFAAEENTSTGPEIIYTEFGYTYAESGEQPVIVGSEGATNKVKRGLCLDMEGGYWCKGQKYNIIGQAAQYSNYDHNHREHKSTAMANDKYKTSGWVDPGEPAEATSKYFYSLNTYRSYYDVK
ncbi:lactococcin 972 family bacteriocin [Bacillus sp. FSL R12-0069]|uniref:lactococcin 972 family bacteriocin n=1 Tax=Bacillus sp. FSL R12-0069 TaxID=2975342 RepID=UPI0030F7F2E5